MLYFIRQSYVFFSKRQYEVSQFSLQSNLCSQQLILWKNFSHIIAMGKALSNSHHFIAQSAWFHRIIWGRLHANMTWIAKRFRVNSIASCPILRHRYCGFNSPRLPNEHVKRPYVICVIWRKTPWLPTIFAKNTISPFHKTMTFRKK